MSFSPSASAADPPSGRRARLRLAAAALTLLSAAAALAAPQSPTGLAVLVEDAAGRPAAAATVTVEAIAGGVRVSARTDEAGMARFAEVADGLYLVSARSADLSASPVEVEVRGGGADPVELTLRFAAVRESVVVSTAFAPRREADSGTFVDTLSAESLEARGEWSVPEALRGVPGTLVRQDGGPGRLAHFQIRGLPASSTAVVVDGAPLRDTVAIRGDAISLLPSLGLVGVERIEVRRGGGSTLYGSSGIGGVLQIVTRSGAEGDATRLAAGLGEKGHQQIRADWGAGLGPDGSRGNVSIGLGHVGVTEGADGDDPFMNRTAAFRAGWRLGSSLRVSARGLYSNSSVGLNESPNPFPGLAPGIVDAVAAPAEVLAAYESGAPLEALDSAGATFLPSANDPDAEQRTNFRSTLLRLDHSAAGGVGWSARFHDLRTRRENDDGPAGPSPWDPGTLRTISYAGAVQGAALRGDLPRGAGRLIAGGEAERETAQTTDPRFRTELGQSSVSGFVQAETTVGRASLRGALRAQRFDTREAELTPPEGSPWRGALPPVSAGAAVGDASASVAVTERFRIRGSWGRGFRAPSLYERFGTFYSSFGYSVYGDPSLAPELTSTLDIGFSAETRDGSAGFRAAYFRSERPQIIGFGSFDAATDPFGRRSGYENTEAGSAQGVETALRFVLPARTRGTAHATWTRADPPENAPDALESDWLSPPVQGGLLLSGTLRERLVWSADLHLTSAMYAPLFDPVTFGTLVFRFPGMRRLDLAAGFDLGAGIRIRAIVRDAFDDAAYTSGGFQALGRVARIQLEWRN